jgi:CheY-like chemotaxis protein
VRLSAEKPDVMLLDFMMPILGGGEMLRAMPTRRINGAGGVSSKSLISAP